MESNRQVNSSRLYRGLNKIYALYHGDNFIDLGTKKYLAELLNVDERTINFYMSPTHKNRTNYKSYIVIKIEEE